MIAIVSSERECSAYASLCESRRWACAECGSLRAFRKLIRHTRVHVVVVRHHLTDGYSDDVIAALAEARQPASTRVFVLLPSTGSSAVEARQVKLGAHCVLRDPVRTEVLLEYLDKYRHATAGPPPSGTSQKAVTSFTFANAQVHPAERQLRCRGKVVRVSPREIELMETLCASAGEVVSYHNLYGEIFGQRFQSNTSNLRVLLSLLDNSARKAGISLRRWVEVIPKVGYRYRPAAAATGTKARKR
jgi:DNA-binding response OmpR family regulator